MNSNVKSILTHAKFGGSGTRQPYCKNKADHSPEYETIARNKEALEDAFNRTETLATRNNKIHSLFNEILNDREYFQDNWDNDGALALKPAPISSAFSLLIILDETIPLPELVPEPDGSLAMLWTSKSAEIIISFSVDKKLNYSVIDNNGGQSCGSYPVENNIPPKQALFALLAIYQ